MSQKSDLLKQATSRLSSPNQEDPVLRRDDHPATANYMQNGAFIMADIAHVQPDPEQPRKYFNPLKHAQLVNSFRQSGVIQPVVVRPGDQDSDLILVAGERRWRAAIDAGLKQIPAIVRTDDPRILALVENLLRDDLRPIEKAEGLSLMIDKYNYTQEQLASELGLSQETISETLSLNRLPDKIKEAVRQSDPDEYPQRVLVAISRNESSVKMAKLFDKYERNILSSAQVIKLSRKKRSNATADDSSSAAITKQIKAFRKYLEKNVSEHNINDVWDDLQKLGAVVESLMAIPDLGKPGEYEE